MVRSVRSMLAAFIITALLPAFALAQGNAAKPKSLKNDYLVGTWVVGGEIDGAQIKGNMRVRTGAQNTCLILNWNLRAEGADPIIGTAIGGPDPKTNRFAEYCFESSGSHFVNHYEMRDDPAALGIVRGERTGMIKGKEYKGNITVNRTREGRFEYTVTSDKGADVKLVFERDDTKRTKRKKAAK